MLLNVFLFYSEEEDVPEEKVEGGRRGIQEEVSEEKAEEETVKEEEDRDEEL